jgi:hypothetical protein
MNSTERNSEIRSEQVLSGTVKRKTITTPAIARRTFLAGGTAVGASVLLGRMAKAASLAGVDIPALKESDIATNGITFHAHSDQSIDWVQNGVRLPNLCLVLQAEERSRRPSGPTQSPHIVILVQLVELRIDSRCNGTGFGWERTIQFAITP